MSENKLDMKFTAVSDCATCARMKKRVWNLCELFVEKRRGGSWVSHCPPQKFDMKIEASTSIQRPGSISQKCHSRLRWLQNLWHSLQPPATKKNQGTSFTSIEMFLSLSLSHTHTHTLTSLTLTHTCTHIGIHMRAHTHIQQQIQNCITKYRRYHRSLSIGYEECADFLW